MNAVDGGIAVEMNIHGFDFDDGETVFIDPDIGGLGSRMSEFDGGTDILGRDFVGDGIERDGGVVFHQPLKRLKEEQIDFIAGEPADGGVFKVVNETVHGRFEDAVMESAMVLFVQPLGKEVVKLFERIIEFGGDQGEKALSDRAPESLNFAATGTVVGLGMNQGDADSGADLLEVGRSKDGAVVAIKDFGEAIGEDGIFEDRLESESVFLKRPGGGDDEAGMIINDAAEE